MNAPIVGSIVRITVAGVLHTFTAAAAENLTTHAFNQAAGDNATATSLAACINAALGVTQITATAIGPVVVLTVDETGAYTMTVAVTTPLTIQPVTLECVVLIEVDASALTNGFSHAAIRVSGPVTAIASAFTLQGDLRYSPPQSQPVAGWDYDL
jgi:hypothetical protein